MAKNTNYGYEKKQARIKRLSAVIAAILALVMIAGTILSALPLSAATSVDKLKDELSDVTRKKKAAQEELQKLKGKKSSILNEIEQIDNEITAAEREIEIQQDLITEYDAMIAQKEAELAEGQRQEEEQYQKLKSRVRLMYEQGSMSYLSILLSSDDFSDFLSRYEIVSQLSKYDKNLFEQLKAIKESIAQKKQELETDRAEAVQIKSDLEANKTALEKRMNERNAQMESIESAEAETKKLYTEIAEEEDRLAEAIRKEIAAQAAKSGSTYVGGTFMWPLPAANNVVTCKYGMRTHPITGVYKLHTGVDLRATKGTNIYAANNGTVTTATYSNAYGNYVVIDHGGGVATLYAHMSKINVSKGQTVTQGTVIGLVGSTGYSTGPHLHFEVIRNGKYTNPIDEFKGFNVVYK